MAIVISQLPQSNAIPTCSDLCTKVADWMHRTDLLSLMPTFVAMAEENMSADIQSRSMDAKTTLTTVPSVSTLPLPGDMVEMRRLQVVDSYNTVLKYVSPDQIGVDYDRNLQARPVEFTVIGGNIELAPIPDSAYSIELTYKQRVPALSSTNPSNWVLANWPSIYLFGTMIQACNYAMDFERQAVAQKMYEEAINNVNSVDWYSGSTMRVRAK